MRDTLIPPESTFEFTVLPEYQGARLDKYVADQFSLYSRTFFNRLIADGHVRINGTAVTKSSTPLQTGDIVHIHFPPKRKIATQALQKVPSIEIIFEHPHFFIVYKPEKLLVHPPSMNHREPTLVDWLTTHFNELQEVGYVDRPGIVHRLDKDTSGILIVPRTNYAHALFGDLFRHREIEKLYYAVVEGHPDQSGTIDLPIGRCPTTKVRMTTQKSPQLTKMRTATTHYHVQEYFDNAALVEVRPTTGRTHQIRVHLAAIGHPIIGDSVYGKKSKLISRQALHAHSLAFEFDKQPHRFSKEPPEDFQNLLKILRKKAKKSH